jgi:hypothetical protein
VISFVLACPCTLGVKTFVFEFFEDEGAKTEDGGWGKEDGGPGTESVFGHASPPIRFSHLNQTGIVSNERNLLTQIGEGRKSMPAAKEVISR